MQMRAGTSENTDRICRIKERRCECKIKVRKEKEVRGWECKLKRESEEEGKTDKNKI